MQDIRENLRKASKQVSENRFEEAVQTLEQVVADSKNQDYVGGKFCAYKHLGDLFCKMERNEDSIRCFQEADGCLLISYLNEPLIREAAESVWTSLCSLTENDPSMKEEYTKAKNKIDSLTKKQQESPSNEYDTIISSQERSFETYDSFFRACKKNSLRQVIRYIHQGLDLNFVNPQTKYTALHQACWYGHSDIVMLLLQHGADPSIKNAYGETARDSALLSKKEKVVEILDRFEKEGVAWMSPCKECSKNA